MKAFDLNQLISKLTCNSKYFFKSEKWKIGHELRVSCPVSPNTGGQKQNKTYTGTMPGYKKY